MIRKLDYKCPLDINKMSKSNGQFYCTVCDKKVHDLTGKTDLQVQWKTTRFGPSECISIETKRLAIVTKKLSFLQFSIILLVNFKSFVLQKIHAQSHTSYVSGKQSNSTVLRTINGFVLDKKTNKPVPNPVIELYRSDMVMLVVKGDEQGKFTLLVSGPTQSDTITLRITAETHAGTLIRALPLNKLTSKLEVKIPKDGPSAEIPELPPLIDPWTGRFME